MGYVAIEAQVRSIPVLFVVVVLALVTTVVTGRLRHRLVQRLLRPAAVLGRVRRQPGPEVGVRRGLHGVALRDEEGEQEERPRQEGRGPRRCGQGQSHPHWRFTS